MVYLFVFPINAGQYMLLTWIVIHVGNSPEGYWSSTLQIELLKLETKTYCWRFRNPKENNHLGYRKPFLGGGFQLPFPQLVSYPDSWSISSRKEHPKSKQVEESNGRESVGSCKTGSFFAKEEGPILLPWKVENSSPKKMSVRVRFCWISWYFLGEQSIQQ